MTSSLDDHDNLSIEKERFEITHGGNNVGMLGFENSLWSLVANGGAWDVIGASSRLDEFRSTIDVDSDRTD